MAVLLLADAGCHVRPCQGAEHLLRRLALSRARAAQVRRVSRHELNTLSQDRPHQGLVLDCEALSWQALDTLPHARDAVRPGQAPPVWVALDEVTDPVSAH